MERKDGNVSGKENTPGKAATHRACSTAFPPSKRLLGREPYNQTPELSGRVQAAGRRETRAGHKPQGPRGDGRDQSTAGETETAVDEPPEGPGEGGVLEGTGEEVTHETGRVDATSAELPCARGKHETM